MTRDPIAEMDSPAPAGDSRALALLFVEALNAHDAGRLRPLLSPGYIQHNRYVGPGVEGAVSFFEHFLAAFPDIVVRAEDVIEAGDRLVGRFTYEGTHRGPFFGAAPTGNRVKMTTIDIWRVEDGLLAEHWDEINAMELFQQVDLLPVLG